MDTATGVAQAIPYTAWQQAVFVVLFIITLVILLSWWSGSQKNWQEFIVKRDDDWHTWMDKANCSTTDAMERVSLALQELTIKIQDHDDKVEERFERAITAVSKAPRKKADGDK